MIEYILLLTVIILMLFAIVMALACINTQIKRLADTFNKKYKYFD